MSGFQCYCFSHADKVIAEGLDDAWTIWCEHTGESKEDYVEYDNPRLMRLDEKITIWCEKDGNISEPGNGAIPLSYTVAFWIAMEGRGFLCSTEW